MTTTTIAAGPCQRWRDRKQAWKLAHPDARFNPRDYEVRAIADDTTARTFVEAQHYSGSYVSALHRFGLYRGGELVGVAVYSSPTSNAVLTSVLPELKPHVESVELGRFVLCDEVPGNAESWMIGECHRRLRAAGVVAVVSFSDPVPRQRPDGSMLLGGHVGTIYQSTNAAYAGRAYPRSLWILPDGRIFNGKAQQKIRKQERGHNYAERTLVDFGARPMRAGEDPKAWLREAKATIGIETFRHPGVHRYVFVLPSGRARRDVHIAKPLLPYPKTVDTCVMPVPGRTDVDLAALLAELDALEV